MLWPISVPPGSDPSSTIRVRKPAGAILSAAVNPATPATYDQNITVVVAGFIVSLPGWVEPELWLTPPLAVWKVHTDASPAT